MKFTLLLFLSATLFAGPSYGFFKDPKEEIINLKWGETTFPTKLGDLDFRENQSGTIGAKKSGRYIGIVADERSLEIVSKYMENPDYHLDNAEKLGFYIGGPALVLGFYIWRRRKTAKQEP